MLDVCVHHDGVVRRATARGRDIYAVTAPLIVEALERVVDADVRQAGAWAAGEVFDAADFLRVLAPEHFEFAQESTDLEPHEKADAIV